MAVGHSLWILATGITLLLISSILRTHVLATSVLETCDSLASAPKMEKYQDVLSAAKTIEDDIVDIRRMLHRRPATKFEEYEAQALVIEKLTEFGLRLASHRIHDSFDTNLKSCSDMEPIVCCC